jgi:hypothetical protein
MAMEVTEYLLHGGYEEEGTHSNQAEEDDIDDATRK